MKILILGATGFLGQTILQRLIADGHDVAGLARQTARTERSLPAARWIRADVARLSRDDWQALIRDKDAIVNCAGALQDGWSDDLAATQRQAMLSLIEAARLLGGRTIVQISARTDGAAGSLPFLATKRDADDALKASGLRHVILRPALVVGRNAHGGTALIRALAAIPFVTPLVHPQAPVETIAVEDVAEAVIRALDGRIASGSDFDLAAEKTTTLSDLVALHRRWLGLAHSFAFPTAMAKPVTIVADLAGRLGWRSPLRSTAMAVMSEGVVSTRAKPAGLALADAATALSGHQSGVQDLWFARLYLLKPLLIVTLALFWLLSGLIPLADIDGAAANFLPFMPATSATALTIATCLIDMLIGCAVLFRPTARMAMLGMIAVSLSYLVGGTILEARLWLDPLGPLVKVLPSIALTVVALAILDER